MLYFKIALLMSLSATSAFALSWKDLVQSTKENSSDLKAFQATLDSKVYKTKEAWAPFSPEAALIQKKLRQFSDQGSNSYHSSNLEIKQNLFSGFGDLRNTELSELALNKQKLAGIKIKAELTKSLRTAAAEFAYSAELEKLNQEIAERLKNNLKLVSLRFDIGSENQGSVLLSEASLKEASYELQLAKYQKHNAMKSLTAITGLQNVDTFDGVIPLDKPSDQINIDELLSNVPAAKELELDSKMAEKKTSIAKSQFYPRVDLTYKKPLNSNFPGENGDNDSIALIFTVPLFSGLSTYYNTRSLIAEESALSFTHVNKLEKLKVEITEAHQNLLNAYALLMVNESFEVAMKLRSKIAEKKYSNGLLKFDDWNAIEKELILKQKALLSAEKNITLAWAHFDHILGRGEF